MQNKYFVLKSFEHIPIAIFYLGLMISLFVVFTFNTTLYPTILKDQAEKDGFWHDKKPVVPDGVAAVDEPIPDVAEAVTNLPHGPVLVEDEIANFVELDNPEPGCSKRGDTVTPKRNTEKHPKVLLPPAAPGKNLNVYFPIKHYFH